MNGGKKSNQTAKFECVPAQIGSLFIFVELVFILARVGAETLQLSQKRFNCGRNSLATIET